MKTARNKLNQLHLVGSFVIAMIFGAIFQSWIAFIIALIVSLVGSLESGDIRLMSPNQRRHR